MSTRFSKDIKVEFEEVMKGVFVVRAKGLFDPPEGDDFFNNSGRLEFIRKKTEEKRSKNKSVNEAVGYSTS